MKRTFARDPSTSRTHALASDVRHTVLALLAAMSTFNPAFSLRMGVLLALVVSVPDLLSHRLRSSDSWAIAFAALMCLSLTWSRSPLLTYAVGLDQIAIAIIFICMRSALRDRRSLTLIAFGYLGGCVYSVWGLLRQSPGARPSLAIDVTNRFSLSGLNTNYTAYALAAGVGVAILISQRQRRVRMVAVLGIVIAYVGIVLTGSRGGILAAVATLVWWLVPSRLRRPASWVVYGMVALGAIGIMTGGTDDYLRTHVNAASDRDPGEISGRLIIWPLARLAFSEHVWFGAGAGTFPAMNSYGIYAHNVFLDVGSGLGVLGLVVILGLFYATLVSGTRSTDPATRALLLGVAVCCLAPPMLTGYWFQAPAAWIALALFSRMDLVAPRDPQMEVAGQPGAAAQPRPTKLTRADGCQPTADVFRR